MIRCLPVGRILLRVDPNLRRNVNVARLTSISLVVAIRSIELTYEIIKIDALIDRVFKRRFWMGYDRIVASFLPHKDCMHPNWLLKCNFAITFRYLILSISIINIFFNRVRLTNIN